MAEYPAGDDAAQVYYDVAVGRLGNQLDSINALDGKGASLFSAGSAVVALTMAVVALRADVGEHTSAWLILPTVLAFLGLGVLTLLATRLREWSVFPTSTDTWNALRDYPGEARWIIGRTLGAACDSNEKQFQAKAKLLRYSQFALAIETVFAVMTLLATANN